MKLLLPNYDFKFEDGLAEIKNGNLYIYKPGAFKEVMYRLTYMIFGRDKCYFCNKKLRTSMLDMDNTKFFSQITLDHLVPQEFGGPTITNNLRPACSQCNSTKGNMYPDEFAKYRSFGGKYDKSAKEAKRAFREKLEEMQEKRRKGDIESLSKEWFTEDVIRNIYVSFWITEPLGAMYKKQKEFYLKYQRLQKPVIISKNHFLLDGFNTVLLAKYNPEAKMEVIMLDNVYFRVCPD